MRKKLYEDVETVYKVISVIFPDEEEIEEFGSKEDAMEYAQEQISSEYYNEVIVSEVTIDEDGYEDETILLDEQSESKSNAYYALHTFYEDEPDEIDIDSLEVFESEEEAMKRAKELEAKGLRVVINIEGDESAGWDSEDYNYSDIGDEIYSTPYTMEEDVKSNKKMRTEEDWENELEDDNSEIFHVMNGLQSVLDSEEYPNPEMIYSYMNEIYDLFIQGKDKELDHVIRKAKSIINNTLVEETFFKSKDKYSILREALDRLDREDNKGKKIKVRAQIRNLRNKLREDFKIRRYPTANEGKKIQIDSDYSVFPINGGSEDGTKSMWNALVSEAKDIIEKENIKYYTISKYIQPNYGILKLNLRTFPSQEAKEAWESRKHGFEEIIK